MVHSDVHALVAEVVGHGQALDAPPAGQAVADEVHAPHLVDRLTLVQRHAFELQALLAAALAHRQIGQLVEPVHALVVDLRACRAQQVANAPVAEAPPLVSQHDDALARRLIVLRTLGRMPFCKTGFVGATDGSAMTIVKVAALVGASRSAADRSFAVARSSSSLVSSCSNCWSNGALSAVKAL